MDHALVLDYLRANSDNGMSTHNSGSGLRAPNWIWSLEGKTDLTEKRRIENATTPMRRSVKAQSTPPKALRSRPPPPAAAEETSGSAIAAARWLWVEGAENPALDPGGDGRPRDREPGAPVQLRGRGDLLRFC